MVCLQKKNKWSTRGWLIARAEIYCWKKQWKNILLIKKIKQVCLTIFYLYILWFYTTQHKKVSPESYMDVILLFAMKVEHSTHCDQWSLLITTYENPAN